MAWTAPRTWVTAEVVTAALMNVHVRDNLLETGPALVTASGQLLVSEGANTMTARQISTSSVNTSETTTSTSFVNLTTTHTLSVVTGVRALIIMSCVMSTTTAGAETYMGYDVSGATTQTATDNTALSATSSAASDRHRATRVHYDVGLTAGTNTFTAKYRTTAGTATFDDRRLVVLGL